MALESFRPVYSEKTEEEPEEDQDLSFLLSEREQSVANFTRNFNREHGHDEFEEKLKGILK
jgi:hypothetical protein